MDAGATNTANREGAGREGGEGKERKVLSVLRVKGEKGKEAKASKFLIYKKVTFLFLSDRVLVLALS
jgi:hypothetical protein